MSLYARIATLPLEISGLTFEPLEQVVPSGWSRTTTVVRLRGGDHEGVGEDVDWNPEDHASLRQHGGALPLKGSYTLAGFSRRLDEVALFAEPPGRKDHLLYRRWAFESAALDLALRQNDLSLAAALGLEAAPLRFVVSTGLGEPATCEPLRSRLAIDPGMRFKLDLSTSWTEALIDEIAGLGVIDTVDLKGLYRGDFTGPPADATLYGLVAERLPDIWIEDPDLNDETGAALASHRGRITWDANIHSVSDIVTLPWVPRCVNIKPSRFGFLAELLRAYEYCAGSGIAMYGGGQFELGPGRGQAQYLASLFHPDMPNDLAPLCYNRHDLPASLPGSPLAPAAAATGFGWAEPEL